MSEEQLVEILMRNAKPSLHHELLHLRISKRSKLREEVRKHEQFYNEIKSFKPRPIRSYVSELTKDTEAVIQDDNLEPIEEVFAIQRKTSLTCWNCKQPGHRFDDCLEPRTIFCFGCGTKDIFKPRCPKCNPTGNQSADVSKYTK